MSARANDDLIFEPSCVDKLVRVSEKDPSIACVQPKILSLHNPKIFDYAGAAGRLLKASRWALCYGSARAKLFMFTG